MLKKLTRSAATFVCLMAGFLVYARGFALIEARVPEPPQAPEATNPRVESRSARDATKLAADAYGPAHWSTKATYRLYDTDRGYWIYCNDYVRENDGKRLILKPFALIWRSQEDGPTSTLSGETAVVDFNTAPDLVRGGSSARVVHASIEQNVVIRDDKGTPSNLGDDLTIGPMTYLEYDENTDSISSESPVIIRDRDMLATATSGVHIDLRRKKTPSGEVAVAESGTMGYQGARAIRLLGHVEISVQDVGRTGMVPGGATRPKPEDGGSREPRPGEIVCDGDALMELPPPVPKPTDGSAPKDQGPTYATFFKNVRIRQGDAQEPEQIDCDRLHLTLVPAEKSNQTVPSADGGPASSLTLKRAEATGHAVWLQSKARGFTGYGQQLIYERRAPERPDFTYFKGDRYTLVTRQNPKDGTTDEVRSYDVTVYQPPEHSAPMSIEAGGPGRLVTRKDSDKTILRTARWSRMLVMQPVKDDPKRRQLTLEGSPMVEDTERGRCTASQKIVATLVDDAYKPADPAVQATAYQPDGAWQGEAAAEPRMEAKAGSAAASPSQEEAKAGSAAASPSQESESKLRIELIRAWRDVVLVTGGSKKPDASKPSDGGMPGADAPKTITAREMLVAHFEPEEPKPSAEKPAPQPEQAPAVAANPQPEPEKPQESKPPEPPLEVTAERIWAWIGTVPGPNGGKPKTDVKEARLRGQVVVHQDPKPGKAKGMDVTGDQVDLIRQVVSDPSTPDGEARLFEVRAYGAPGQFAYVGTDSFSIEGRALGLDQSKNYAVVMGPGRLVQEKAGGDVLGDETTKGQTPEQKPQDDPMKPKGPLTITWGLDDSGRVLKTEKGGPLETWMRFYGKPKDENGQPGPAKAYFYNHVHGWTEESELHCARMIAYLDREIDFRKAVKKPQKPADPQAKPEPVARVVRVMCEEDVEVSSIKRTESGAVRQRQKVLGDVVTYEKETNEFHVESPGTVYLYDRKKPEARPQPNPAARSKPKPEPLGPLELTKINFEHRMDGQLNSRRPGSKSQTGEAEFFGNVRTIRAVVPDENADLDADHPPREFLYTVSETVRVRSEPPPPGATGEDKDKDRVLLQAWGKVYALTGKNGRETAIHTDDHMNYDSATGMSIIYGGPGGVLVVDQNGRGEIPTQGYSSVVRFNHKTGQHQVIDAHQILVLDPNSGQRTGRAGPKEEKGKRTKREMFPKVKLNSKNRRGMGFSGF